MSELRSKFKTQEARLILERDHLQVAPRPAQSGRRARAKRTPRRQAAGASDLVRPLQGRCGKRTAERVARMQWS